jgi:hypothetical protein
VPDLAVRTFGALFAAWAAWKSNDAMTPRMCGDPSPMQFLAMLMSGAEIALGAGVAAGRLGTRRLMAIVGVGAMLGLVGFALVADARHLPTRHCFCFGGIELPWKGHAAVAAALALPWLAILIDTERRLAPAKPDEVADAPSAERPSGP